MSDGRPRRVLDPAGGAYSTPLTPSWCGWVNPFPKNPISLDSSGLAFTRPQYPQAQHPYLKILSYGPVLDAIMANLNYLLHQFLPHISWFQSLLKVIWYGHVHTTDSTLTLLIFFNVILWIECSTRTPIDIIQYFNYCSLTLLCGCFFMYILFYCTFFFISYGLCLK